MTITIAIWHIWYTAFILHLLTSTKRVICSMPQMDFVIFWIILLNGNQRDSVVYLTSGRYKTRLNNNSYYWIHKTEITLMGSLIILHQQEPIHDVRYRIKLRTCHGSIQSWNKMSVMWLMYKGIFTFDLNETE
jgi:hypothetical protein